MHTDTRPPSLASAFFYVVVILGAVFIISVFVATLVIDTRTRTREQATGTQAQVYDALDACSITGPFVTRDEQTGAVRVGDARGNEIEDCLRRRIPEPQDAIILGGRWWGDDTHIPGQEERDRLARERESVRLVHEDRAQFLRENVVGYVSSRLDLTAEAVTVDVTESPKGQWKHEMVIDLGEAEVDQRVRAGELIAVLRESQALDPEDTVVVRANRWPDATL